MASDFQSDGRLVHNLTQTISSWTDMIRNPSSASSMAVDNLSLLYLEILDELFNVRTGILFQSVESSYSEELDFLVNFIYPEGPLFDLIDQLMIKNCRFSLFFSGLYSATKENLLNGLLSSFTQRKADFQTQSIHCNALEYFFYRYFDYAYVVGFVKCNLKAPENAFSVLFQHYLKHFLPTDKILSPLLQNGQILQRESAALDLYSQQVARSENRPKSPYGLIRPKFLQNFSVNALQPDYPVISSPTSSSNNFLTQIYTFLQILTDFWLVKRRLTIDHDAYICHLLTVMLERVYAFVFINYPESLTPDSTLKSFKRDLVEKLLTPNFGNFFDICFHNWPLDSSFEVLCSLWLTFLHPWHFAKQNEPRQWALFVNVNHVFYWKYFKSSVDRFLRCDLESPKISRCVLDVFSSFSVDFVLNALKFDPKIAAPNGFGYYDADFIRRLTKFCQKINTTLSECERELNFLKTSRTNRSWTESFVEFFNDLLADDEQVRTDSIRSMIRQYRQVLDILSKVFLIRAPLSEMKPSSSGFAMDDSSTNVMSYSEVIKMGKASEPDHIVGPHGERKLTPKGRMQILNRLSHFDFDSMPKNPPLSFASVSEKFGNDVSYSPGALEVGFLVEFWNMVATEISTRYADDLERLFYSTGCMGRLSRLVLSPPIGTVPRKSSADFSTTSTAKKPKISGPRVSLRFLASYKFFLIYFSIIFLFWQLLNVNPVLFMFSTCLFVTLLVFSMLFL